MTESAKHRSWTFNICSWPAALAIAIAVGLTGAGQSANAQTFTVIHTFTGAPNEGALPMNGVVIDRAGNLYGVTFSGGIPGTTGNGCTAFTNGGCGTVFKLTRHGSGWIYSTLYKFQGVPDGNYPAGVVVGPDGALYGATFGGGIDSGTCANYLNGCGVVFRVRPPATFCASALCLWNESLLHAFTGANDDGANPGNGDLIFDSAGTIYGTTEAGGATNLGTAYKLTPSQGGWEESVFFSFDPSQQQVAMPGSGLIMDKAGNLYGSSGYSVDGNPSGAIYQLVNSQSGWMVNALQIFHCVGGLNGCFPDAPIFDPSGNLVAATSDSGFYHNGTAIKLLASDNWSIDLLYTFQQDQGGTVNRLAMDSAGNLYGTGINCSSGYGCVYKLTPTSNGYIYTDLHDFNGRGDGISPYGPVAIDANGNLYGTAELGGDLNDCFQEFEQGCGTVWEITP